MRLTLLAIGTAVALALGTPQIAPAAAPVRTAAAGADRCTALDKAVHVAWPEAGTRLLSATWHEAGPAPTSTIPGKPPLPPVTLPPHCEMIGIMHEHVGADGQHYAIKFHLRLPDRWNGRFFMQGGGGSNGELGDAIGRLMGSSQPPALVQGYAVLSQDSGHDNAVNGVPAHGGAVAFGFDPQARAEYGGTSLPATVHAARALIGAFYGRQPEHSYFVGCSKGGQEGMMLATRYPELFDGIIANDPGFSLPRAALAEAWDTQAFAAVVRARGEKVTPQSYADSFSAADFALVRTAVLAACDKDDGLADGMVNAFTQCTSAKVLPQLARLTCHGAKQAGCLSGAQVEALRRIHEGVRDGQGRPLYAPFYWDAGWGDMAWRVWKTGGGPVPAINVAMGAPSLAAVFGVPPQPLPDTLDAKLAYALSYDFDRDAKRIYATGGRFVRSAWTDIGARSDDLGAFNRHGGKLMIMHGVSDPVFSLADTVDWYRAVEARTGGRADGFARLFAIPGMAHCAGGPATDRYDEFAALVGWVEQHRAPDRITATAGPATPWPGRTRPLCAFPKIARYKGKGDINDAADFICS